MASVAAVVDVPCQTRTSQNHEDEHSSGHRPHDRLFPCPMYNGNCSSLSATLVHHLLHQATGVPGVQLARSCACPVDLEPGLLSARHWSPQHRVPGTSARSHDDTSRSTHGPAGTGESLMAWVAPGDQPSLGSKGSVQGCWVFQFQVHLLSWLRLASPGGPYIRQIW